MLEAIWQWFLDLTALLVTPDWGSLIALLPIAIMAMVLVWIVWMIRRFRVQPKARRGKMPVPRKTPAGVHMPGPSFAPVLRRSGRRSCSSGWSMAARSCSSGSWR